MGIFDFLTLFLYKRGGTGNALNKSIKESYLKMLKTCKDEYGDILKPFSDEMTLDELKNILDENSKIINAMKAKKAAKEREKRKELLIKKYGEEAGVKISAGTIWQDMTKEMLVESWGKPEDEKVTVFKSKTKEKCYYSPRETQRGTTVYKYEVRLENDVVVGWKELE